MKNTLTTSLLLILCISIVSSCKKMKRKSVKPTKTFTVTLIPAGPLTMSELRSSPKD
ncbi:MAG: hypothetical protein IPM91_21410 [Bacteroidetes bacterium]|nr:hypothetical protein [Bacteroidota bacterium]